MGNGSDGIAVQVKFSMPFTSKSQMRAAFGGYLGPVMKEKAQQWAKETPDIKHLPRYAHGSAKPATKKGMGRYGGSDK